MWFKKKMVVLLLFVGLGVPIVADSIDGEINRVTPMGVDTSDSRQDNGGFYTEKHLLSNEMVYHRTPLTPEDLDPWIALWDRALALQMWSELQRNQVVEKTGIVTTSNILFGRFRLSKGQVIPVRAVLSDFNRAAERKVIWQKLHDRLIINDLGDILGVANPTKGKGRKDPFLELKYRLKRLELGVRDRVLEEALILRLFELMKNSQHLLRVTEKTATNYHSRSRGNIIEQVIDSLIGNAAADYFFPGRVRASTHAVPWSSDLSVVTFFDTPVVGLNSYPFRNKSDGLLKLNGHNRFSWIEIQQTSTERKTHLESRLRWEWVDPSFSERLGSMLLEVGYHRLTDADSDVALYTMGVGKGMVRDRWKVAGHLGAAIQTRRHGQSSVGLNFGASGAWFPVRQLGFETRWGSYLQPDFWKSEMQWSFHQLDVTARALIGPMSLGFGYQWLFGSERLFMSSWTSAIKIYF